MKNKLTHIICVCLVLIMALQTLILPSFAALLSDEDFLNEFPALKEPVADNTTVSGLNLNPYQQSLTPEDLGVYAPTDRVSAIVKLSGESVLSLAQKAGVSVADYARSSEGQAKIAEMTAAQNEAIRQLGSSISNVKHRYTTLFSGFSCTTEYQNLEKIEGMFAGSSAIIGERYIPDAQESTATDNALNAYGTGIYNSSDAGYTGEGMVVAILDTGLDYTHTAFERLPEGTLKLTKDDIEELFPYLAASSLNESGRWEETYYSDKVIYMYDYADKDTDVYPVNDHGTHVAGIIAGKDDTITGVAIDSQLAIFKVFGNEDAGAETEDILAALSDAVLLGVDVINMSLGSSCGFSRAADEEGVNEVYDAVRASGINLIVAASNSHSSAKGSNVGDTNLKTNPDSMTLGSPATYDSSLAVASVLGAKTHYLLVNGEYPVYLTKAVKGGKDIEFYDMLLKGNETAQYEYVLVPGVGNEGNYANIDVTGKIAIIKRGVTTFEEKVQIAAAKGAVGAIIYNNVSGTISMSITNATLPTCSISMDAGAYFVEHPTGVLHFGAGNLAGPFMSDFSSWGPNSDLILNPDLTSYGGDITSAVRGGYDVFSGTSMACPNLAGSAALVRQYVKQKYPTYSDSEVTALVNCLLMSTASILRNEAGNPYSPRKQGSGLADAERAIKSGAYLFVEGSDKAKLSLGDDPQKTGKYTLVFTLKNTTDHALSYVLDTYTMTETISSDGKTVAEQAYMLSPEIRYSVENGGLVGNTVSVLGYSEAIITVEITLSENDRKYMDDNFANGMYVEGFCTLTSKDGDSNLTIPYLAFYGDWTKAPLLDATAFEEGKEAKDTSILEDEKLKADVYATIPMVGFYSGNEISYYYMCKPAFILADGYEAPATLEDYCALTTSTDGNFMLKYISAGLLRNAKSVHMTIVDPVTGNVIFEKTAENCRKSYYNGNQTGGYIEVEFDASTAGLANNTKYVFNMTCELDWEGEQHNLKNEFSFTFYIDNEAPVVDMEQTNLRVERDKEGNIERYLLDLYVYDNRFLSGYFMSTYEEKDVNGVAIDPEAVIEGFIPVDDMLAATSNKVTIDLTSVWHKLKDGDTPGSKNIEFTLYDYAKNRTVVDLTLEKSTADTVNIKNGRKTTEKGDEIIFNLKPYQQINLLSTQYLVTSPKEVYYTDFVWSSSDEEVATVQGGIVTPLKNGEAIITVATPDGNSTAQVTIRCSGQASDTTIPISGLTLNATRISLVRGETYELYASFAPYNATTLPNLVWDSYGSPYITLTPDPSDPYHCTVFAKESGSALVSAKAEGTLFSATCNFGIAEEFEYLGQYLKSYTGKGDADGVVEIPADKGVTRIYRLAFYNNKDIRKVIIPEGVEQIEYAAFYGCENLREIVLPSTCKQIDEWAFGHNESLEIINLGQVQTICQLAFYGDSALKELDLSNCHTICDRAFSFCTSLKSVDISTVGQIGKYCFVGCTGLEELKTSSLNKIADYAFAMCSSLRSLNLYATYVGENAFYYCSGLTDVIFESDVTEIDAAAFYYASALTNVSFKKSCKYIGDYAFTNCSALTSVYIPAGCEYLGDFAFAGCRNVKAVSFNANANLRSVGQNPFYLVFVSDFVVEEGSKYLTVKDGILYDKNMTKLILCPFAKSIVGLVLPDSVKTIGDYALSTVYSIISVNLNRVTEIGEGAFMSSGIQTVYPGTSLRRIGDYAFASCDRLETFVVPDGVETIGEYAFADSNRTGAVLLPDSLKSLGAYAYAQNAGITSVTIPAGITELREGVFAECTALTSVTMNEGVAEIGDYAFFGDTALTSITFPASVTALGEGAFALCENLDTVNLSEGLTEIPDFAFYGATSLVSLTLPEAVTAIGRFAFFGAEKLEALSFGAVETIGDYAFVGTALETVDARTVQTVGEYAFAKTALTSVNLPAATEIGAYAFAEATELTSVSLDKAVNIGTGAFVRATKLSSVSLPACETVGDLAFAYAGSLTSVDLPALKTIGSYAIYNTKISSLSLPASLTYVAPNALTTKAYNSTDDALVWLDSIVLDPASERFFLDDCGVLYQKLTDNTYLLVAYPSGKTDTNYTVLDKTVRIEAYAFSNNRNLESVTVARTVKSIGAGAFYGCTALSSVDFLSVGAPTLESLYSSAAVNGWSYCNFVYDYADAEKAAQLTITVPKNAAGYDTYLWKSYLGDARRTEVNSMTDGTAALNESILNLPEIITLADAETVDYLELMYNATSSDQKAFVQNVAKLQRAIAEVKRLRAEQNADTPDDPNPTPPIESPTDGLPTYAIVLIVVGAVVLTAGVGVTVVLLVIKKKKTASQRADGSASDDPSDTTEAAAPTDSEETAEKKGEDTHEE
ncbi:MAG: leucine-rich repeat protein [Clostridia bacterium]|nr:leucine-rich repeat protein [Clostridia bacterium]MDY6185117.1 leucine-rich repeat protein [Eubacteriales bacterium]